MLAVPFRAQSCIRSLAAALALSAALAFAGPNDLVFLGDATNPSNHLGYKAYLDKSTIHTEGRYQTVKLISVYAEPFSAAGYNGIKSMVNTFQVDCSRHVKRVTYIAFLNSDGGVIVDQHYSDAGDEQFGSGTIDGKTIPYLCGPSTGQ